jgi:hypothetical protein
MTDVFISYANEDRDTAARLAAHLESIGWSVWWDRRIPAGRTWRAVLENALTEMRCMIVLWSRHSVESTWVAEEAEEARRLGKTLVPVLIERVEPPIGFRAIQAADLAHWDGSADDPTVQMLVADLRSLLGAPRPHNEDSDTSPAPMVEDGSVSQRFLPHWWKAALGVFAIAGLVAMWHNWPNARNEASAPLPLLDARSSETEPRLTDLSVSGDRRTIKPSERLRLTLTGKYSDGSTAEVKDGIEWSSSDTGVATVDERGEVKGLQAGTTQIIARIGGLESSEWTLGVARIPVVVKPLATPKLVALQVSSSKRELFEQEKIPLVAKGRYSDDSEKPLSSGIEWRVSDRTIAAVNARGELVALRPGKVEVFARAADLASSPLTFRVKGTSKRLEPPPNPVKAAEPQPAKPAAPPEHADGRIAAYIARAQTLREQGNYGAALA